MSTAVDTPLALPPVEEIHARLTRNQRERRILRDLLRISLRAADEGIVTSRPRTTTTRTRTTTTRTTGDATR